MHFWEPALDQASPFSELHIIQITTKYASLSTEGKYQNDTYINPGILSYESAVSRVVLRQSRALMLMFLVSVFESVNM